MSTSGSFVNASPPCPTNVMTRMELLALRTAGTLRVECHYRVQGPSIGTAGNTSATVVEMHAVSGTELSTEASVDTNFGSGTNTWPCIFDIDLGTAGTFTEIRDTNGNVVRSTVADAPNVHTQFPWHGAVTGQFRNNLIDESTLTGWGAITTTVRGNQITRNSTVALTGNWGIFTDNRIEGSTVNLLHSAGGTRTFSNNSVRGGASFQTTSGATGSWTVTDNEFLDGYVVNGAATSTSTVTIDGSRFEGHGATGTDALIDLGGTKTLNNIRAVTNGAAQQFTLTGAGTVTVAISESEFLAGRLTRASTTSRGLTVSGTQVQSALISHTRTGGTGTDTITDTVVTGTGTSVLLAGATDPATAQTVLSSSRVSEGSTLTLTNPAGAGPIVSSTVIDSGAAVSGTGTTGVTSCRFAAGCTVTLGAFTHDHSIVDGNFAVTATANNSNRLTNKAFSDWL